MKTKILATLIGSVSLGLAGGSASHAFASARYMHNTTCYPNPDFAHYNTTVGTQLRNPSLTTEAHLFCPFNSDATVASKRDHAQINVDVYTNGNFTYKGAEAQSCITYAGGGGGICDTLEGGFVKATRSGTQTLPITPFSWTDHATTSDYPYVWIILAPMVGGSANVLFGFNVTNP